jgi:UDP-galactopyranose mutase
MDLDGLKYLVVGAGLTGAVVAERLASRAGERVLVVERRDHLAGNCHSAPDPETGIECHTYGSHIFHTRDREVWDYVRRFTGFNHYRHKVLTRHAGRTFHMPVNLMTLNTFFGTDLSPWQVDAFLASRPGARSFSDPANLEEQAVNLVGRELYEAFIRGYTAKQWDCDPRELPAGVITRLPFRKSHEVDYFTDPHQGIPLSGYTAMVRAMLDHELIEVALGVDYAHIRDRVGPRCTVVYTGPVDEFFGHALGRLSWRGLRFERRTHGVGDHQGCAVCNYADADVPWTRVHEFRHLHPEREYPRDRTVTFTEYPLAADQDREPCYPVNTPADVRLLAEYQKAQHAHPDVVFAGRLGLYRYLDMDQAVRGALDLFASRLDPGSNGA